MAAVARQQGALALPLLIADALVLTVLAQILESAREIFPHLDIDYIRYPDDVDFCAYFAKSAHAVQHLIRSRFTSDVQAGWITSRKQRPKSRLPRFAPSKEMFALSLGRNICSSCVRASFASGTEAKTPSFDPRPVQWLQNRPSNSFVRSRKMLLFRLTKAGSSETYLKEFGRELALIEDVIEGDEFRYFIQPYLSELSDQPKPVLLR